MLFAHEYEKRLRVGFIGAGEHACRNVLPCLQYAPVDLLALADHDRDRGMAVARQFGARRFYPNHKAMLAKEQLDAVFVVLGLDAEGRVRNHEVASEVLRAGFHCWIDKIPCNSAKEINTFTNACMAKRKYVATGFRRMFAPAYLKVAEIIASPAFGQPSSFSLRYPLSIPAAEMRDEPLQRATFHDLVHPYSLLVRLFGESEGLMVLRNERTGGAVVSLRYRSGLVGALHLTGGQSLTSPLERLEVVGNGANVVVENGVRLTYYRAGGSRGDAAPFQPTSFIGPDEHAPLHWEPEFTLVQPYNKDLVLSGYQGSINHFCERLVAGEPPKHGNLVEMLHIMSVYDRLLTGEEAKWLTGG